MLTVTFSSYLQLNSRTSEAELLQAFSQFGRIVSHTIRRPTNCAYIDYDDAHAATLARRAMNGALLGGSALRVEFKVSSSWPNFSRMSHHVVCCIIRLQGQCLELCLPL